MGVPGSLGPNSLDISTGIRMWLKLMQNQRGEMDKWQGSKCRVKLEVVVDAHPPENDRTIVLTLHHIHHVLIYTGTFQEFLLGASCYVVRLSNNLVTNGLSRANPLLHMRPCLGSIGSRRHNVQLQPENCCWWFQSICCFHLRKP